MEALGEWWSLSGEATVQLLHHLLIFPPRSFQYLMEGSYNKVFLAKGNIPAESYTFFIDILLDTIRCVGGQGPVGFGKSSESGVRQLLVESHSGHS